jgi:hypothetical protein
MEIVVTARNRRSEAVFIRFNLIVSQASVMPPESSAEGWWTWSRIIEPSRNMGTYQPVFHYSTVQVQDSVALRRR